jgi:hypothetical protein
LNVCEGRQHVIEIKQRTGISVLCIGLKKQRPEPTTMLLLKSIAQPVSLFVIASPLYFDGLGLSSVLVSVLSLPHPTVSVSGLVNMTATPCGCLCRLTAFDGLQFHK